MPSIRPWARRLRRHVRDQRGVASQFAIAIVFLGLAVVAPTLALVEASFRGIGAEQARADAYYAASAGIERVLADLRQGALPLRPGPVMPSVTFNGHDVIIDIAAPPAPLSPLTTYVDPNTSAEMATMTAGEQLVYTVFGVVPNTPIDFMWNFTPGNPPGAPDWRIEVFEGIGTGGNPIRNFSANRSPADPSVNANTVIGGDYTFRFMNESGVTATTAPFSTIGSANGTWMRMQAGIAYAITATAGTTTVRAIVLQVPGGATSAERAVNIENWIRVD